MKPIYFPFTYVCESALEAMAACFRKTILFQPTDRELPQEMQAGVTQGVLEVCVPVKQDARQIQKAVRAHLTWANFDQRGENLKTTFFARKEQPIPFFDDSSSSNIIAGIKHRLQSTADQTGSDPLFNARVFLYFAEEFDRQIQEISQDLVESEERAKDLISELKGPLDAVAESSQKIVGVTPDAAGEYMLAGRLAAWTRLLLTTPQISALFVTHSRALVEDLIDRNLYIEKIFYSDAIPLKATHPSEIHHWQDKLMTGLTRLAENPWPASADEWIQAPENHHAVSQMALTIYGAPNQRPDEFFARWAAVESAEVGSFDRAARYKNTLLALIEF